MNKILVSFTVVFCAIFLHQIFGGPVQEESDFDRNGEEVEQEAKNLGRFQEAIRKALSSEEEARQPYAKQEEIVEKDSLSNDVTAPIDLDENKDLFNMDVTTYKPKKIGKCWGICWCRNC
ncbi:hypothetical protein CHS0354_011094 [Potamilus streckersoni]|nr:hypothetical protein CHS0354_011094 [Potamilus streckersoni]